MHILNTSYSNLKSRSPMLVSQHVATASEIRMRRFGGGNPALPRNFCTISARIRWILANYLHKGYFIPCAIQLATFGNYWQLMATFSNFWHFLVTFGNFWQLVATFGNLWQPLATYGNFLQLMAKYGNFWHLLATLGNICQLMVTFASGNLWQLLSLLKLSQLLTKLKLKLSFTINEPQPIHIDQKKRVLELFYKLKSHFSQNLFSNIDSL